MTIVGIGFNAMNALAFDINDIYLSMTLFYGGCLMASNMIWAHEIIHYLTYNHMNIYIYISNWYYFIYIFCFYFKATIIY